MTIRIALTALLCLLSLALFTGGQALAQDEGEGPPKPKREKAKPVGQKQLRKLAEALGLNEEQMAKLKEMKKAETDRMRQFRKEQDEKLKGILNEEQYKKFSDFQKKFRKRMDQGGQGRPGGRQGGRPNLRKGDPIKMIMAVSRDLGLTEEQQQQLRTMARDVRNHMVKIVEEARASGDYKSVRAKVEELQKALLEKVKSMLDPEQVKKLDAFLKGGKEGLRRMGQGRQGRGGRNPEEIAKFRTREIQKALNLLPEEAMILMPKVQEIMKAQGMIMGKLREQRMKMLRILQSPDVTEEQIETQLKSIRAAREAEQKKVEDLQAGLRELLTLKQEAILVLHGVLR